MNSFLGGFEAVWEIDLWGRVRRMNEAARANFMATQEGRRSVMISLVSGVARAYFELLELDEQLAIAKRTRDSYERTLKLFSDQHAGGLASKLGGFPRRTRAAHGHGDHPGNRAPNRAQGKRNQHAARSQPRPHRPHLDPAGAGDAGRNPGRTCPRRCWSGGPTFARPSSKSARPTRKSAWPSATFSRASA